VEYVFQASLMLERVVPVERRKVDVVSVPERESLDGLAIVFLWVPLIVSGVVILGCVATREPIVAVIGLLICVPVIALALGYMVLVAAFEQAAGGSYRLAEILYKIAAVLMSLFRLGSLRNFQALPRSVLAELLLVQGKYDQAEVLYRRNANLSRNAAEGGDDVHCKYLSTMLKDIGRCAYLSGRYADAFDALQRAIIVTLKEEYTPETAIGIPDEFEKLGEDSALRFAHLIINKMKPKDPDFTRLAFMILYFGAVYRQRGRLETATALMSPVMQKMDEHFEPTDPELIGALIEFAHLQKANGDLPEATRTFHRAKDIANARLNYRHPYFDLLSSVESQLDPIMR
jgi:tetratricopeptide (TPR) repeat protein